MAASPYNKTYFYIFLVSILLLSGYILWPMKDVIMISWIIVTLFMPVYLFFSVKLKFHRAWSSFFSVLTVALTILFPITILINLTIDQFQVFYRDIQLFVQGNTSVYGSLGALFERINNFFARIPYVNYQLSIENAISLLQENLSPIANSILDISFNLGVGFVTKLPLIIVLLYLLWFGFPEYDRIIMIFRKLSPLPEKLDNMYVDRITIMIKGIVKGTFSIAIIQGTIAWVSIMITGIPYAFFWTLLVIFFSIIPLGAWLVTVPLGIGLVLLGNVWQGLVILGVQILITSNIDNLLRPVLIPKNAEIHPALLLLSFIGGIQVFGVAGLIYGPIIMVIMVTTFEIYQRYYKVKE